MYFSVVMSRPGQERAAAHQRLDDDAYGDHQWLWQLFPAPAGAARDFLYRRQDTPGLPPRYHVVSARAPLDPGGAWQVQTRDYEPDLAEGDRLAFELRACPTVRHGRDGKSKRHDVVMEAKRKLLDARGLARWKDWDGDDRPALNSIVQTACVDWLARRGERVGFDLDTASCTVSAYQQFGRQGSGQRLNEPQFSSVDMSGHLVVRDPEVCRHTLFHGLGSAKAFGCGLLLVRRVASGTVVDE